VRRHESTGGRARAVALALGAGRMAIGAGMLAAPSRLARTLGVDTPTARRTSWLASMVGIREVAVGAVSVAGGLGTVPTGRSLLLSASCDVGDAIALGVALRNRRVATVPAVGVLVFAALGIAGQAAAVYSSATTRRRLPLG
jgi:hypothetical protein